MKTTIPMPPLADEAPQSSARSLVPTRGLRVRTGLRSGGLLSSPLGTTVGIRR